MRKSSLVFDTSRRYVQCMLVFWIQLDQHRENREPYVNATDIAVARLSFGMPSIGCWAGLSSPKGPTNMMRVN